MESVIKSIILKCFPFLHITISPTLNWYLSPFIRFSKVWCVPVIVSKECSVNASGSRPQAVKLSAELAPSGKSRDTPLWSAMQFPFPLLSPTLPFTCFW